MYEDINLRKHKQQIMHWFAGKLKVFQFLWMFYVQILTFENHSISPRWDAGVEMAFSISPKWTVWQIDDFSNNQKKSRHGYGYLHSKRTCPCYYARNHNHQLPNLFTFMYIPIHTYINVYLCMNIYTYVCIYIHIVYIHIYAYCTYVHVYVYI